MKCARLIMVIILLYALAVVGIFAALGEMVNKKFEVDE